MRATRAPLGTGAFVVAFTLRKTSRRVSSTVHGEGAMRFSDTWAMELGQVKRHEAPGV